MKRNLLMLPCVAAVAIALFAGKKYYGSHVSETSSLLMQNVEALAESPEVLPQKCTKPKLYGSCVDEQGRWKGTWIDEVEEYEVYPGSPIPCDHFSVHGCPSGSHKG